MRMLHKLDLDRLHETFLRFPKTVPKSKKRHRSASHVLEDKVSGFLDRVRYKTLMGLSHEVY
ncbi:hypothetical protein NC651_029953 [Populus alba x Populus x berolinensis]|nr:hypothetical protein NC651_029953 [Populus alba x Populus x berolinensis]